VSAPGEPRRQVRRGGFVRQRDARAAMQAMQAEVAAGWTGPGVDTFAGWLTTWVQTRQAAGAAASTTRTHDRYARDVSVTLWAPMPVETITAGHLDELYRHLGSPDGPSPKPLGAKSIRDVHAFVHAAMSTAVRQGVLMANPAAAAQPPSARAARSRTPRVLDN